MTKSIKCSSEDKRFGDAFRCNLLKLVIIAMSMQAALVYVGHSLITKQQSGTILQTVKGGNHWGELRGKGPPGKV